MSNFDIAIARLLDNEGGYVNDPADPGGETKWGICKRDHPDLDIAALTRDDAINFYRGFWGAIHGNELVLEVASQLLGFAVNAGTGTAIRKGQEAAGVADDGHWGPVTQTAIIALKPAVFTMRFAALKTRYYTKLTTWPRFGAGWMNRVAQDLEYAAQDEA
jgi:lysozyme family protein